VRLCVGFLEVKPVSAKVDRLDKERLLTLQGSCPPRRACLYESSLEDSADSEDRLLNTLVESEGAGTHSRLPKRSAMLSQTALLSIKCRPLLASCIR
jgi:hypothetical protein